jgi:hypothetical protein
VIRLHRKRNNPKDALLIKQMELNALALFEHYGLGQPATLLTLIDRTFFLRNDFFMREFLRLVPEVFDIWSFNQNHGLSAIAGWRERRARCSMQLIEHEYGYGVAALEADFDIFNPQHGLFPAIGHLVEVLWPGKTSSFRIARMLRKRGIDVPDVRKT